MTFLLNQSVVYPMHGVGTIKDIRTKEFNGEIIDYYEIHFPFSDMIFMVPVAKVDDFGIRALVSREKVEEVFDVIKEFEGQIDPKKIKDGGHEFYKKSLQKVSLIVLQLLESLLILVLLYQAINRLIFVNNYSIKFMLTFILYSPEFFMANLTLYYFIYEKFKILQNIIVITKLFQIILTLLLFILGFTFKLYVYQTSLAILLGITVVYLVFNVIILALIKAKIKTAE